jgi:hypothetical protein
LVAISGIHGTIFFFADIIDNTIRFSAAFLFRGSFAHLIFPCLGDFPRILAAGKKCGSQFLNIEVGCAGCNLIAVLLGVGVLGVALKGEPAELAVAGGRNKFVVILQ